MCQCLHTVRFSTLIQLIFNNRQFNVEKERDAEDEREREREKKISLFFFSSSFSLMFREFYKEKLRSLHLNKDDTFC